MRRRMNLGSFYDLYDYLCSNMVFDSMAYMNRRQLLFLHDDQDDTRYEYDESIIDRGHCANSSSPL